MASGRVGQFLTGQPDDIEFLRRTLRFTDIDPAVDKDPSRHSGTSVTATSR